LDGECRRVVVCANADPSLVGADVVNAIGIGPPEFLVNETMNFDFDFDFDWFTTGQPRLTCVFVFAYEFLLLCVYRNDGLIGLQGCPHRGVDMLELGITVGTLVAFKDLDIGLVDACFTGPSLACIASSSLSPTMIVVREMPVAAETADIPPRPRTLASTATKSRRCRSSSASRITAQR